LGGLVLALSSSAAWAGPQIEDIFNTCTDINCKSQQIRGVSQPKEPFVIQVFAGEGECLRFDVVEQTRNTEMLVVPPGSFFTYYNDDREPFPGDDRPLIIIDPVATTGWHAVIVNYWNRSLEKTKFKLKYGRYDSGNPNCQEVTNQISIENN